VEITHGFDEWFECGFYFFPASSRMGPWMYVGSHIRPRFAVPERYHLPVDWSISNEIGWQRPRLFPRHLTWEMRPIVDKKIDKLVPGFNPTLDRSLHGPRSETRLRVFAEREVQLRRNQEGGARHGVLRLLRPSDRLRPVARPAATGFCRRWTWISARTGSLISAVGVGVTQAPTTCWSRPSWDTGSI